MMTQLDPATRAVMLNTYRQTLTLVAELAKALDLPSPLKSRQERRADERVATLTVADQCTAMDTAQAITRELIGG